MIIYQLIIKDIIKNDVLNTFKTAQISTLFYQILEPILNDKESLLSKKIQIIKTNRKKNCKIEYAAHKGHKDLVKFFIELNQITLQDMYNGDYILNCAIAYAAEGGHKDLVNFLIKKGVTNWNYGMDGAAHGGHKDLVDFFIEKGADAWDWGMESAVRGGHKDLVDFFIEKGADAWNWGMRIAAGCDHKDIEEFLRKKIDEGRGT